MAISVLRLRRSALSLSSFIINHHRTSISSSIPSQIVQSSSQNPSSGVVPNFVAQFRAFRSSDISLARPRTYDNDEDMKIGPDDILFEGCDYNHWLITMDFPKDPKPSPEEMVETYVQTAAKVLGSVEKAKKAMYACSTTTYNGFQVQVSEDVSKKFEGLPGVVFILPDSYIDPVSKEYGGDKYENGIITHRPPPIQYGRQGGRFGDRNRDFNRQSRPQGEYQQGNRAFDNRGQVNSGNFGPRQNPPPQQNYGPPRDAPLNYPAREHENHQGYGRDQMPPNQGNYNQGQRGNFYPQQQRVPPQEPNNHAPPQGGNFRQGGGGNYGPGAGSTYGQPPAGGTYGQPPAGGTYGQPPAGGTYGQPPAGGTYGQPPAGGTYGQPQPPAGGTYGQPPAGGTYGQPPSSGNYGQVPAGNYGQGVGSYGHGTSGYGQGAGSNYGQGASGSFVQGAGGSSSVHGEDQRFSQGEQMNDLQQVQR